MAIESVRGSTNIIKNGEMDKWNSLKSLNRSGEGNGVDGLNLDDIDFKGLVQESPESFGEFLASSMAKVNQMQQNANVAMQKLATGKSEDVAATMLMVEEASIAFKTMNQIRMKVIDAYKEVMKMQV